MKRNYTVYHLHTDLSNGTTNIDSVTKASEYVDMAKSLGMKALAFSEHGNIFDWLMKKELVENAGMKYIHGVEMYVTESLSEKKRDNYHVGLYAKNFDGFLEINKLVSVAANRRNGHFYYVPRITFEELINTSNNIIITTACVGGILAKSHLAGGVDEYGSLANRFYGFLIANKDRCFLEVQHHADELQIRYNMLLKELSLKSGIRLIAGTDTHALNEKHALGRSILQKSKNVFFEGEETWDITFKTYDELWDLYKNQIDTRSGRPIWEDKDIEEFLNNTNVMAEMVEEYSIDKSFKYPKLAYDSENVIKNKINNGILRLGINKYDNYKEEYIPRIKYELEVYKKQGAIDYLLLDEDIKTNAKKKGIFHGPSRGSVSGSLIAYILGITEIDPIIEKLNFERFMSLERISLADVDTDWPPSKRDIVKEYVFNKPGLCCADIITFNTVALKGSIRDCGRALGIDLSEINEICKNIDDNEEFYRKQYKELFEYVDIVNGTIVSVGSHPCGSIVSPIPLDTNMGLTSLATSENPISMLSMKMVDKLNFVKLDILSLDNIEIINETCKMAGIERLTCSNTPYDENVYKSMRENTVGIFQWESDSAKKYLEKLFSDETIRKIKAVYPDFKYIDLLSVGNGAIRPAGASYREELSQGIFRDNGHEALNKMLAPTLGYLVYQEQIIEFLNKFCGFTMGQADMVRRAFAKKTGTEDYIPKIKQGFIATMQEKYGLSSKESEKLIENFLQVIIDASDYLFSLNHSQAYSYIGYICAYLRYHYPLEFFTVSLNVVADDMDKTAKIMSCLKEKGIKVEQPTYGKSRAQYFCDKENNTIYKGIESVKFLNKDIAENLYSISQLSDINNFVDLYYSVNNINSRQWDVLIKIGYFKKFGSIKKLLRFIELKNKYKTKNYKKENLTEEEAEIIKLFAESETEKMYRNINQYELLKYLFNLLDNDELKISDLIRYQFEFMGSSNIVDETLDRKYCVVISIDTKYTPTLKLYRICNGDIIDVKVYKREYVNKQLTEFNIIYVNTCQKKNKKTKDMYGNWIELSEFNYYITYYIINS